MITTSLTLHAHLQSNLASLPSRDKDLLWTWTDPWFVLTNRIQPKRCCSTSWVWDFPGPPLPLPPRKTSAHRAFLGKEPQAGYVERAIWNGWDRLSLQTILIKMWDKWSHTRYSGQPSSTTTINTWELMTHGAGKNYPKFYLMLAKTVVDALSLKFWNNLLDSNKS